MAKKPGDSTRFTPTGVWTHTKPGNRSTVLQFADPAPPNETPQQKVKRLREAANRMKMAQITGWDVAYFWGRVAADYAHRTAVYTIVFATGCIGVLAVFSIGDMIVYNRRKRSIYFQNEERRQADILQTARDCVANGTATPAQTALVQGIAEEEMLMAQKVEERSLASRILWRLNGKWREEKELAEQRKLAVEDMRREAALAPAPALGITQAVQDARANIPQQPSVGGPVAGGPLDQAAAQAANKTSTGWLGWMFGGSKKTE